MSDQGHPRRQRDRFSVRINEPVGSETAMQVVVQNPVDRAATFVTRLRGIGLFGGVGAQQIMEDESPGHMLAEQVRAG